MGMRRLAIIDLVTGKQPIHNEDETVWVILNGEIYNFTELRADLETKGHRFYTNSDTEAIAHAYEEYGTDVPKYLRGMFAFALWTSKLNGYSLLAIVLAKSRCLLAVERQARFRLGVSSAPLPSRCIARRESGCDLALPLIMCVPAPMTAFSKINKLEPGHVLVWQNGEIEIKRYWSLDFKTKIDISEREAGERVVELLRDAVRARLISDVPLGAFLSGGIDSSASWR